MKKFINPSIYLISLLIINGPIIYSQTWDATKIKKEAVKIFPKAVDELNQFLQIPNDGHYPDQMEANVKWCINAFRERSFKTQVIRRNEVPFVFAEYYVDGQLPTILFYLQIDGQPVDRIKWDQANPFKPVLKRKDRQGNWEILPDAKWNELLDLEWRIFARSASDSKGPAMSFIKGIDVIQNAQQLPAYNLKVVMDFQEEMSSPELPGLVIEHKDLFRAECLVVMDGTRHLSNKPTLMFGARGIATAALRVYGPSQPMHSGQYGNYVPNPVFAMARLIASMKNENGLVLIPKFYDGIKISHEDKQVLREVPENESDLLRRIGIAVPEQVAGSYQEALQYPTLNVKGLQAAYVGGKSRTIIPAEVIADIDVRLVPETQGEQLMQLIKSHIIDQGFHLIDGEPTEKDRSEYPLLASFRYKVSYDAYRTPFDSKIGNWLNKSLTNVFNEPPVRMRTTGGSQPISPFIKTLNLPAVSVRIPNPDNNIHAANENLRLQNYLEGIQTCIGILLEPYPK